MNIISKPSDVDTLRTAILGASGYTGAELLRLAKNHPAIDVKALTADRQAGKAMADIYPHLATEGLPDLVKIGELDFSELDLVFCALPHATTQEVIKDLPEQLKVIDLSADFRITNPTVYEKWYGKPHGAPELQGQAAYGLTEWHRPAIGMSRLIAVPGCYPTVSLLALLPLVQNRIIEIDDIIIDAKSGVTGAGRGEKLANLFSEVAEGMHPYGVGHHRHMPEIEQELSGAAGAPVTISFTPHLVPMNRGMLATIYVRFADGEDYASARQSYLDAYDTEAFVHLLPEGAVPATRHVRGTNHCLISITPDRRPGCAIITAVIDNLMKGASGQAVQNFNVMQGLDETTGLDMAALFP
ncbi:MAG: N-acetyl-gamma-glutamyl-phosphate reductase [Alphaproteobacteria bacterium]|nr:N-acetyl-gamma-glutamyl-phosphate reductase [Alphaproteobacteria bacterium SS10]